MNVKCVLMWIIECLQLKQCNTQPERMSCWTDRDVMGEQHPLQQQCCIAACVCQPVGHSEPSPSTLHSATLHSRSGRPHAHLQRSRSHRHHRLRHPGPRSDAGQAAAQRGLLRHPQPPSARQDGRRVQSLRKHVWTHARHVPGNIRCVCLCH